MMSNKKHNRKRIVVAAKDVAAYILKKVGPLPTWKLQKLLYYSQAWSLVWDDEHLFRDKIEAWPNGPVVPGVYKLHKGKFEIARLPKGNPDRLSGINRESVNSVLKFYGDKSAQWLSDLACAETPWREARAVVPESVREHSPEIIPEAMAEYYGSL